MLTRGKGINMSDNDKRRSNNIPDRFERRAQRMERGGRRRKMRQVMTDDSRTQLEEAGMAFVKVRVRGM